MKLIDTHCHLQFPQFDADREEVLQRMREKEMGAIVVGTDYETSKAGIELAEKHDFLWASVGLHPNDNPNEKYDISYFESLARDPNVVAIGECGLDYFRSGGTLEEKSAQKERFEKQIELALKVNKPLIIHCRNSQQRIADVKSAHDDLYDILFSYSQEFQNKSVSVAIHFFTGSGGLAQKYLDLGCYLSFPGPITYTDMYDESIEVTPLEKMLVETDAPFAAPVPYRGKRNEPAYVVEVVKKMAQIKGISENSVQDQLLTNAKQLFKLV